MLDRATIDRLSRSPEKNAPTLNVALAEEGTAKILLALARSPALGPEALDVIARRVEAEGADVGRDRTLPPDEQVPAADDLDRLLVSHPRAPGDVLERVLARHAGDPFFVLAAAAHRNAPARALEQAVDWPAASPAHDRLWLALLDPNAVPPLTLEEWSQDASALRREAVARMTREPALLSTLSQDRARQVRRAVASNRLAAERPHLAEHDPAPEVRARAGGQLSPANEHLPEGASVVETARFAAALRAMTAGGVLAPDVLRALSGSVATIDVEGAMIAGMILPRAELLALLAAVVELGLASPKAVGLAAGVALRPPIPPGEEDDDASEFEHTDIVYDALHTLIRTTTAESKLTGKARLAAWAAEGLVRCESVDQSRVLSNLAQRPLAAERVVLARASLAKPSLVAELCAGAASAPIIPGALLELGWADRAIADATLIDLAHRVAKPKKRAEDLPEDEVDLDPTLRPLDVLEKVVLAAAVRVNLSPRAALATVALDARRVRYVLSAMPTWKGRISGGKLARILRQNAGALSVAHAESRARGARIEGWTERLLTELELAIALAVGHVTGAEVARRIGIGRQTLDDGISLAIGAEVRAALEGPAGVQPIVAWATKNRTRDAAALVVWLLLEKIDRERDPIVIAASIDSLAGGDRAAPKGVIEALAIAEHRRAGRLETIHPQSPRGRTTLASAINKAYRSLGGMRDERL